MNSTIRLCRGAVLSLAILASPAAITAQEIAFALFDFPPVIGGTYFSLQAVLNGRHEPPLPFNPFPELPVYQSVTNAGVLFYDDRTVDYAALKEQQALEAALMAGTMEGPPVPPGGGGGGGGTNSPPPQYASHTGFTLWPPQISGTDVTLVLTNSAGDGLPLTMYDIYATTNLSPYVPGLNLTNWLWLGRTTNSQTVFLTVKLSDEQCWYRFGMTNDFDFDGLTDAYERIVSHTLTNSFNLLTSDGQTPDGWYLLHGLDPKTAGAGNNDPDLDALANRQEYLWGTDPRRSEGVAIWVSSPTGLGGIP